MSNAILSRSTGRRTLLATALALAAPLAAAQVTHSGHYWNPAESGWGAVVTDQGNVIGLHWYTLDHDGEPTWFMAATTAQSDGSYAGDLLRIRGVPFAQIAGQASDPAQTIGNARLRFVDGVLEFDYVAEGSSASKSLQRFNYNGRDAVCSAVPSASRAAATNYTDHWWNAGQSGWGMQVTHIDDAMYITWYTYDGDREALYFNGIGERQADGSFSGRLYRTHDGTPFTAIDGAAAASGADEVGSFRLRFADGENATFDYTVGNVSQSKPITRLQFGSTATVCESKAWQIDPAAGGSGGGGTQGEECLPPMRIGDQRRVRVVSTSNGTSDTLERDEKVVRSEAFQGAQALVEEVSGATTAGTGVYATVYYGAEAGDTIATLGGRSYDPASGALLATSVNQPLRIESPRRFSAGDEWQKQWKVNSTAQGFATTTDVSAHWRYLGREQVTTPAGTFDACKFTVENEVRASVSGVTTLTEGSGTSWTHPTWGLLKSVSSGTTTTSSPFGGNTVSTTSTLELLSATRNGQTTP